jgi:hypothetical protein
MRASRSVADPATIGLRVKSGWAAAVLLTGPASRLRVSDRRRIELSDPAVPESYQPYHNGTGTARTDQAVIARLTARVRSCTLRSLSALLAEYRGAGHRVGVVRLVVGSVVDPMSVGHPHIRAHASEGRQFRTALEGAARGRRLPVIVVRERDLYAELGRALGRAPGIAKSAVSRLGEDLEGSWRAEHKAAAAVAWLAHKSRS